MKYKKILPTKTTIIKSIIIIILLSIVSTYVTSALSNQERITPDNPFQEEVNGFYSNVPLFKGNLDVSSNDEQKGKETEQDNQEEEDKKEKENNDQQHNEPHQKEETIKKDKDTVDKQSNPIDVNQDIVDGEAENEGANPSTDTNEDALHTEIIDTEDDAGEQVEEINDFFKTSIQHNEIIANKEFSFTITQLEHEYKLIDIDINIDSTASSVEHISDDFQQPIQVMVHLTKGENNISIAATYTDENNVEFTVFRNYTVIFDEDQIVIETNLKNKEVTKETIEFNALAKQGEKEVPLSVHLQQGNEQIEVKETKKNKYVANLKEGKNEFILSANSKGNEAEEIIIINYEKPTPPDLKIETNLVDFHHKKVKDKQLNFTANAYDHGEEVDLTVFHNDKVTESEDGTYNVDLIEGENVFELKAEKNAYSETSTYLVYYEPEATGGEVEEQKPNEKQPEITIFDLSDGETIKNSVRTFHVKAKNHQGESITNTGKVNVTNNGEAVPVDWADSQQISFKLAINNGPNEITVHAEDKEGNTASKTITIHGELDEDGAPIGTATVSMEATTVGLGYLIAPHQVEIYQGERASYVLDRVLKNAGFKYMNSGSLDSNFYMEAVHQTGIGSNITIPEDLMSTLEDHNIPVDLTNVHPDVLGEHNLTSGSGWMYSVNGVYANVGFADYYLKDGDELRIRYTLVEGNDIGLGLHNFHKQW